MATITALTSASSTTLGKPVLITPSINAPDLVVTTEEKQGAYDSGAMQVALHEKLSWSANPSDAGKPGFVVATVDQAGTLAYSGAGTFTFTPTIAGRTATVIVSVDGSSRSVRIVVTSGTGLVVAAAPLGPPTPSSGWHVEMADAFAGPTLSDLWFPGRDPRTVLGTDEPGDNPNELEVFNSSQVSIAPGGGLLLTQTYQKDRAPGKDYVSGTVRSWVGVQGRRGFSFLPGAGQTIVVEIVVACPVNPPLGGGNDLGWWACGPTWKDEIDFFEQFGSDLTFHADPLPPTGYAWIYDTSAGSSVGGYWRVPQGFDGKPHKWTTRINADKTSNLWIDGIPQGWFGANGTLQAPPQISQEPLSLIISWALRLAAPGFVSGSRVVPVPSVVFYQDAAHAGVNIIGGGVAPGTSVQ